MLQLDKKLIGLTKASGITQPCSNPLLDRISKATQMICQSPLKHY